LYEKNNEFKPQSFGKPKHRDISEDQEWGGAKLRIMLQCIYAISFLCLLRFDEVLRIELKDIEVIDKIKGHIKLTLPFRKTHQYGGKSIFSIFTMLEIKPFHLFYNRKELHLDPVHLLLRWINISRLKTGPLFRRIDPHDRVVINADKALVKSSKFTKLIIDS
jgi:hypothetical protein